jgi:hypothetical protein
MELCCLFGFRTSDLFRISSLRPRLRLCRTGRISSPRESPAPSKASFYVEKWRFLCKERRNLAEKSPFHVRCVSRNVTFCQNRVFRAQAIRGRLWREGAHELQPRHERNVNAKEALRGHLDWEEEPKPHLNFGFSACMTFVECMNFAFILVHFPYLLRYPKARFPKPQACFSVSLTC